MLKMPRARYDELYGDILAGLDPQEIHESLGDNAVLLCWEKPGVWCHRRLAAEWFEGALSIVVPEFGFSQKEIPSWQRERT
jgi:hypothetical protein